MTNGLTTIASILTVVPFATQAQPVQAEIPAEGVQPPGGDFSELLSGLQFAAKMKVSTDLNQAESVGIKTVSDRRFSVQGEEVPDADLLVLLQTLPPVLVTTESGTPGRDTPEKFDDHTETMPHGTEISNITAQLALTAYVQPGRTPDVSKSAPVSVDVLQKVPAPPEQPVGRTTRTETDQPLRVTTEPVMATAPQKPQQSRPDTTAVTDVQPLPIAVSPLHSRPEREVVIPAAPVTITPESVFTPQNVSKPTPVSVDALQKVAAPPEQSVGRTTRAETNQPLSAAVSPLHSRPEREVVAQAAPAAHTPESIFRPQNISIPAPVSVDVLQKVAAPPEQPVSRAPRAETDQPLHVVAEPVMTTAPQKPQRSDLGSAAVTQAAPATISPESVFTPQNVSKPASVSVDALQKVAAPPEQPVGRATRAETDQPLHSRAEREVVTQAAPATITPETEFRSQNVSKPAPVSVDALQKVAAPPEQPDSRTTRAETDQPLRVTTEPVMATAPQKPQRSEPGTTVVTDVQPLSAAVSPLHSRPEREVVSQAAPAIITPESVFRPQNVSKPAPVSVDVLQKVAAPPEQPVDRTPRAETDQPLRVTAEPAMATVVQPVKAVSVPAPAAAMMTPIILSPASPVSSSQLELEIQLSQPRPITAPAATASASAATTFTELNSLQQQLSSGSQTEKVRVNNGSSVAVKEMTSTFQGETSAATTTSMAGSNSSDSKDNNQELSDHPANGNPAPSMDMHGGLITGQQNMVGTVAGNLPEEPLRNNVPEQVVQQLKERLVQHDIKPGNQQITLTLSPDSLGELKMNLNLQGQKLSVEIVTESRSVRDAIVQHTDALKESLARQNITMESFDVTTGGKGSGSHGQNQNAWRELTKQQQQQQFWTSPRGYAGGQADQPSVQALQQQKKGHSMLDIHY